MTDTVEAPQKKWPMSDPAVRAKAAATRAANKAAKLAMQQEAKPKRSYTRTPAAIEQRSEAARARWSSEDATEEEVRRFFTRGVEVEEGLKLLARMRKNCEIASYALNQRITADDSQSRCKTCGGAKKANKQWALIRPKRDPVTQLVNNEYFCQIACVALENQKTHGVKGISDSGMTSDMNPRTKPPV